MEVVGVINLSENGISVDGITYFDDNMSLPNGNYIPDGYNANIAGRWVVINSKVNVTNPDVIWAYREIDDTTLIRLPYWNDDKFLPNYDKSTTPIPHGIDALIREAGYNLGVNLNRKLDGQEFTAVLGLKLTGDIFLGYEGNHWELIDISDL